MPTPSRRAFYVNNLGLPLLLAALVFLMFDLTSLDRLISNLLLDPLSGQFPLLHNQWFEKVTHKWPRILPNWTGELAVIGLLLSFIWPRFAAYPQAMPSRMLEKWRIAPVLRFTTRYRRDLLFVVVAFTLCTTVIHYLKSHTSVYCPVETTLYGGTQLHQEWFVNFTWLDKPGAGRCWPGGHASSGFTLLALYFVALRHRWAHARKLLVAVLLLGLVYGTARVLQGWHYMSHTFWAGIFVWLTTWLTALFFYGRLTLQAPARACTRQRPQPLVNATQASLRPE
ncbi:phosphatase PAP2 family protein [Pseudomonas tructae]|uniref:Phosphatase PAP2 family protein n=1 Tax=Pseudomonas tructae TaxID=2518644 RepID=A0A411MPA0_9PSED|nr:phosphatase PAP2 family protein [Pseudomonas tructae]QBF28601.1 phosphatase PAP2 family protein [Pseudomonas tructae]